jgi:hypothetical protein
VRKGVGASLRAIARNLWRPWSTPFLNRARILCANAAQAILLEEGELTETRSIRAEARARAVDPLTGDIEVSRSRSAESDASFREERITVAIERLKQRHEFAVAREKELARLADRDAAERERDQLVEELKERYPQLAGELADLLGRIKANDERCRSRNTSRGGCGSRTRATSRRWCGSRRLTSRRRV